MSFDNCRREIMGGALGQPLERNLSWFEWSFLTALSRDGSRILFEEQGAFSREGGEYQIYVRATDGAPSVSIGEGYGRSISADGKWVVAKTGTPPHLELLPTGAGVARTIPLRGLQAYYVWDLTADQTKLFLLGNELGHGNRIFVVDVKGDGNPRAISPEGTSAPMEVAPDGKRVIAQSPDQQVTLYSTDDTPPKAIAGVRPGETVLAWTDDGKGIFVAAQGRVTLDVNRIDLESGERTLHHTIRPADAAGVMDIQPVKMTPDGRHYAYGYRRYLSDLFVVHGMSVR
jgi:hypothetical protein